MTTLTSPRSPMISALASVFVPGLGQLSNGERAKGVSLLVMAIVLWVLIALAQHWLDRLMYLLVYGLAVWLPAVGDAYQTAAGRPRAFVSTRPGYVIPMLLLVGPFALTLLWSSPSFSRRAKTIWTIIVIAVAVLFFLTIGPLTRYLTALQQQLVPPP